MKKDLIRRLENWLTVPEAAEILNRERARIHQLVQEGKFSLHDLRIIGGKRILLIREEALLNYKDEQDERIRVGKEKHDKAEEDDKCEKPAV